MIKKIKNKILILSFIIFNFAFVALTPISAQNLNYKIPNPSKYNSVEDIINTAGSLLRPVFLITFGAMILYGAFLMLTSQGDEGKIENSKKTIMAAIVGFAIAALAPTLVRLVTSFLGVESL